MPKHAQVNKAFCKKIRWRYNVCQRVRRLRLPSADQLELLFSSMISESVRITACTKTIL